MRVALVLLACATMLPAGELGTLEKEMRRTVRQVSPTIVALFTTYGQRDPRARAAYSGVVLDSAGTVLTTRGIVTAGVPMVMGVYPGSDRPVRMRAVKTFAALGVTLLRPTLKPKRTPRRAFPVKTDAARPGTPVILVGAIWGDGGFGDPSSSWGSISSVDKDGTMRASTRINIGTQGGPVFDLKGGLVGVAVREHNGETIVVPYDKVRELDTALTPARPRKLGTGLADAMTIVTEEVTSRTQRSIVGIVPSGRPAGSGIILEPGFVLCSLRTLLHDGGTKFATPISVVFDAKGNSKPATLHSYDARIRIALLKVETPARTPTWKTAEAPPPGSFAVALGFPDRVTFGIVSRQGALRDLYPAFDAIHTDAHVGIPHAGGALVDIHGKLLGLIMHLDDTEQRPYRTQKGNARYGGGRGLGFVVPMKRIAPLLARMKKGVLYLRPYLGVKTQRDEQGLEVLAIRGTSPSGETTTAHQADLKKGDILQSLAGRKLATRRDLQIALHELTVGDEVELVYRRGDKAIRKRAKLGKR